MEAQEKVHGIRIFRIANVRYYLMCFASDESAERKRFTVQAEAGGVEMNLPPILEDTCLNALNAAEKVIREAQ